MPSPSASLHAPAHDRLLTPLGGLVLGLVLSVSTFWLPALDLLR